MKNFELLQECKLQLEYLNEKFGETGTTNSLLAKLNQALHIHGIGSKRLDERSEKIALLENFSTFLAANNYMDSDWRDEPPYAIDEFLKAACASGGEGTVAEGAGREIKDYRIEQPTEDGVIGTEFGFTEHNGE